MTHVYNPRTYEVEYGGPKHKCQNNYYHKDGEKEIRKRGYGA